MVLCWKEGKVRRIGSPHPIPPCSFLENLRSIGGFRPPVCFEYRLGPRGAATGIVARLFLEARRSNESRPCRSAIFEQECNFPVVDYEPSKAPACRNDRHLLLLSLVLLLCCRWEWQTAGRYDRARGSAAEGGGRREGRDREAPGEFGRRRCWRTRSRFGLRKTAKIPPNSLLPRRAF